MQEQDKVENRNAVLLAQHEVIVDLILENQQFKNDQAKYSKTAEDATNYRAKVVELQEGLDNLQDQRDLAMKIIASLEKECEAGQRERQQLTRKLELWSKYLTAEQIFNIEDQLEKEYKTK